ncbi:MAG TPA: GGDEF domain-containing protein [Thermoanaerobaculaceae bacterium]|nr:GGDEF domain-containing protein [Thermoanaerobaculaceae bacterium]
MITSTDSDSGPRLLPVGDRLPRRGRDLERFINLWRLALVAAAALALLGGRVLGAPVLPEERVAEWTLALLLGCGLALQFYLAWRPWSAEVSSWVVALDVAAVTAFLLGCVVVDRAIVATNSQMFFFYYFFVVVSAGLRGDPQGSRIVAWSLPASYLLVVLTAVEWREVNQVGRPDEIYGSFRWEVQVARLLILGVLAWMVTYDVGLVATDRAEARTDALTGVYNRRFLEEFLGRELSRARRSAQPLSILLLDLDGFKAFNDEQGHLAGDRALAAAAACLRDAVRATDVVARYGGDEFVVVLPNTTGEAARRVARELTKAVPAPLRFSVGIGCLGEGVHAPAQLFAVADAALLRAKRAGGGAIADAPAAVASNG